MGASAERLEQVDRELAALGVQQEKLSGVVAQARRWTEALGDLDEALADLAAGADLEHLEARTQTRAAYEAASSSEPPATRVTSEPDSDEVPLVERPLRTSDIAGLSVDELFADAEPSNATAEGELSNLFDDALDLEPSAGEALSDLSDLENGRLDLDALEPGPELADALEASPLAEDPAPEVPAEPAEESDPQTQRLLAPERGPVPPPKQTRAAEFAPLTLDEDELTSVPPPRRSSRRAAPNVEEERLEGGVDIDVELQPTMSRAEVEPDPPMNPFGNEDEEELTSVLHARDLLAARGGDDFELLVDEDMLEVEPDDLEELPADEEPPAGGSLISRILGRK